jgi:hypothetical protein
MLHINFEIVNFVTEPVYLHVEVGYVLWATVQNFVIVLDLVSQVHNVVLMNVYLGLGNSGGRDFGMGGI